MELTRLKKKRITAVRGHKLLKDKRDELMRQYLDLVRENMEVRKRVEAGILSANKNFVIAKAGMSEAELHTALMAPKQEINLIPSEENVMSVEIPKFEYKTEQRMKMIFIHMDLHLHPAIWMGLLNLLQIFCRI